MVIDDRVLDEIRSRASIVDVISEYVNLNKKGSNYMGLCPFHSEKTPSFSVSESKQIFHCFGCHVGGDVITFIMKRENLSFIEAVKFLADKYGIELGEEKINREELDKRERCYEANLLSAKFFMESLKNAPYALEYLEKREIGTNVINSYGIGFADERWDSLLNFLKSKGFCESELLEYNLISKSKSGKYFDRFRNRIMFPIVDLRKRVIAFGGRVMDDSMPKYLNSTDTLVFHKGNNLYNQNIVKDLDRSRIILVEGYMDVISLYKSGIKYSVASLGTALTTNQAELVKKYGKDVYICYDGDSAGIKATRRAIDILRSVGVSPKIVRLPEGLDPDDYLKKYGKFNFELTLSDAISYFDFLVLNLKKDFDTNTSDGLTGFTTEIAKLIATIKNPIERDIHIEKLSKDYNITRSAVVNYLTKYQSKNISKKTFEDKKVKKEIEKKRTVNLIDGEKKSIIYLLSYAATDERYLKIINRYLDIDYYLEEETRNIFRNIKEAYEKEKTDVLEYLRENGKISEVNYRQILDAKLSFEYPERIIEELSFTIKKMKLETDLKTALSSLEILDKNVEGAKEKERMLLEKIIDINKKLKGGM